jgi:hypothetical protein
MGSRRGKPYCVLETGKTSEAFGFTIKPDIPDRNGQYAIMKRPVFSEDIGQTFSISTRKPGK